MSPRVVGDGLAMSANVGSNEQQSVQSINQVGGVRAFRLKRDLGITSVYEVSQSSPAELMQITSVGPVRAKQIFAGAQKQIAEWREANTVSKEHRVAVFAGEDVFDDLDADIRDTKVVDNAIDKAGISLDDNTRIGFVTNGEMGGDTISRWFGAKADFGSQIMRRMFETPWSKYSPILDPLRHVDDGWLEANNISEAKELPKGRMPDTPSYSELPFDVSRDDEIGWWMPPAERTARMVSWADEVVVVVDGQYGDQVRRSCKYRNTECTTIYQLSDGYPLMWTPSKELDHFEPDADETVRGGNGVREGSVPDLESDDEFRDGPNDCADQRPGHEKNEQLPSVPEDTGGSGVGSNMNRWG